MYFKSKKTWLVILGIIAVLSSRGFFFFVNDPEGPNLLIVLVLAASIYIFLLILFYFLQKYVFGKINL